VGDQLKALRKEVDDAEAAYLKLFSDGNEEKVDAAWREYIKTADATMPRVVELAAANPKAPEAFEALEWVIVRGRQAAYKPWGQAAIKALAEHHADNPRLGRVCYAIGRGYYWDEQHEPAREFLRAVAARNPDRAARALASYGLGHLLSGRAEALRHRQRDPASTLAEAEKILESVVKDYADVKEPQGRLRPLGQLARAELFEIRHLAIGKVAPDIEGEDLDGRKFKLSDYRGKVVVLDFWGHW
jgi:hypothetical protein